MRSEALCRFPPEQSAELRATNAGAAFPRRRARADRSPDKPGAGVTFSLAHDLGFGDPADADV